MAKIAIAGGSGQVAQEIIDVLILAKKHTIRILTRNEIPLEEKRAGVEWAQANYSDVDDLVRCLRGFDTVLSFVQILQDPDQASQKNLIDACIAAGVKRFAPSEYGSSGLEDMPWYAGKAAVRSYLEKVNENGKVLEYTLFQPGLFLNYLASPYKTAAHVEPLETMIHFEKRRAIVVEDCDAVMTLTTVQDLAEVVARAVDYSGQWPKNGGIRGNRVQISKLLEIGAKARGGSFAVEKVKLEDLEAGVLETSWVLEKKHAAVSDEQFAAFAKGVLVGTLLSSAKGSWDGSDEFNQIFPDYKFEDAEEWLCRVWEGKP